MATPWNMRQAAYPALALLAGFSMAQAVRYVAMNPKEGVARRENARMAPAAAPENSSPGREAPSARPALGDAVAGDDPFHCAANLLDWLQKATVEDFRRLAANPKEFPWPHFSDAFREAYADAVAERWLALDPEALSGMQRIADPSIGYMGGNLLEAAGRLQPALVLEKLPLRSDQGYLEGYARAALGALAAQDYPAANSLVEHLTDPKARTLAKAAALDGVAKADPLKALSLAQQNGDRGLYAAALYDAEKFGSAMVRQILESGGGKLGVVVPSNAYLLKHPEIIADLPAGAEAPHYSQQKANLAVADRMSKAERDKLLSEYDKIPASLQPEVAAAVACAWALTEPEAAANWALAHAATDDGASPSNDAARHVFLRWLEKDSGAALGWYQSMPPSAVRDAVGTDASTQLAEAGDLEGALALFHPRGGRVDQEATQEMVQILAERDPASAGALLATLPADAVSDRTATELMSRWYVQDPAGAASWVDDLAPGHPRDQAALCLARQASSADPAGAAQWVDLIDDPLVRQQAAAWVYSGMSQQDPAGARDWLSGESGFDPEWQARILRRGVVRGFRIW